MTYQKLGILHMGGLKLSEGGVHVDVNNGNGLSVFVHTVLFVNYIQILVIPCLDNTVV